MAWNLLNLWAHSFARRFLVSDSHLQLPQIANQHWSEPAMFALQIPSDLSAPIEGLQLSQNDLLVVQQGAARASAAADAMPETAVSEVGSANAPWLSVLSCYHSSCCRHLLQHAAHATCRHPCFFHCRNQVSIVETRPPRGENVRWALQLSESLSGLVLCAEPA